jgi:hypothetical protein
MSRFQAPGGTMGRTFSCPEILTSITTGPLLRQPRREPLGRDLLRIARVRSNPEGPRDRTKSVPRSKVEALKRCPPTASVNGASPSTGSNP